MLGQLKPLLPTVAVLAFVAWSCWPYLEGGNSQQFVAPQNEPLRIPDRLLSTETRAVAKRNPFAPWAPQAQRKAPDHEAPVPDALEESPTDTTWQERSPEIDITKLLGGVTLNATFIRGDRRLAMIQGRLYEQGQPLADVQSATPCIVAQILPDRVFIEHDAQTLELKYPDVSHRPDRTAPAPHDRRHGSK